MARVRGGARAPVPDRRRHPRRRRLRPRARPRAARRYADEAAAERRGATRLGAIVDGRKRSVLREIVDFARRRATSLTFDGAPRGGARRRDDVVGLYVFGSRGRDFMVDERSDWDVCVVLRDAGARRVRARSSRYVHGARVEIVTATLDELRNATSEHGRYAAAHARIEIDKTGGELTGRRRARVASAGTRDAVVRRGARRLHQPDVPLAPLRHAARCGGGGPVRAAHDLRARESRPPVQQVPRVGAPPPSARGLGRRRAPAAPRPRPYRRVRRRSASSSTASSRWHAGGIRRRRRRLGAGRPVAPR